MLLSASATASSTAAPDSQEQAITLALPQRLSEKAGRLPLAGRVSLTTTLDSDLLVSLSSSDPTELALPASLTIPAGQSSALFDLLAVDDTIYDGAQALTITASSTAFASAIASVVVADDEVHHFSFAPIGGPQIAGTPFSASITARDIKGQIIEDFDGAVDLAATGAQGPLPLAINAGTTVPVSGAPAPRAAVAPTLRRVKTKKYKARLTPLGQYHNYNALTAYLNAQAAAHPDIAQLYSLGRSAKGRQLWALKITDNPDAQEDEPEFKYVSTLHGDEPVGTEMTLYLIDRLLSGYGRDRRISRIVDSTELWLVPLANPDGLELGRRTNAAGVDLNRSFPDGTPPADLGTIFDGSPMNLAGRPREVAALMQWSAANSFTLSAGIHTGELVVNYPYDSDGWGSVYSPTPDEDLFRSVAQVYSSKNQAMWNNRQFRRGITNGADWYEVNGSMQDWVYRYLGTNEVTLELSKLKKPPASKLAALWKQNRESMLAYIETVQMGARGLVTDALTGRPLYAQITVAGNAQPIFTDPDVGDYHRMLLPGTYDLTISAPGYTRKTIRNVVVRKGGAIRIDAALMPQMQLALTDGTWSGSLIIDTPDPSAALTVLDEAGHLGRSSLFAIETGSEIL